jgi:hypothetical protein
MSRSGYIDDGENPWLYRGSVARAIMGKRGQAFLRELVDALDALPTKRLIAHELIEDPPAFVPPEFARPQVCAIGAVGLKRGVEMAAIDPRDHDTLGDKFNIASILVAEIEFENDEAFYYPDRETPENRWQRMRDWAQRQLRSTT